MARAGMSAGWLRSRVPWVSAVSAPVSYRNAAAVPLVATEVFAKRAGTGTFVIALAPDTLVPTVR